MANPNIVNVTSILGGTTYFVPTGTSAVSLLNNAAASGNVIKINSLVVANLSTTINYNATVSYYTKATTQGSAPSSGVAYQICSTVAVPANASLVVIEKTNGIYLLEDACISITSSSANNLVFTVSYEVIS